jgi:hypothetical protein
MATGTSLILIALGAILAFAVSVQVAGIDIETIGIIVLIVGIVGLLISLVMIAGYAPWGAARSTGAPAGGPLVSGGPPASNV